jgi:polysaccharide export outer membrane protein
MKKIIHLIIFALICTNVFAQLDAPNFNASELLKSNIEGQLSQDFNQLGEQVPAGNDIDPEFYFIGPGDILALQVLSIHTQKPVKLKVNPDVSVIVPRMGKISLKNKTLAEAGKFLDSLWKLRNPEFETSLSLYQPRICIVDIEGNVFFPQIYNLPSTYTVSTAIKNANQFKATKAPYYKQQEAFLYINEKRTEREREFNESGISPDKIYSSRNIKLLRRDGSAVNVDIELAVALDNPHFDPYVKEGDKIVVPFDDLNYPKISIAGPVFRPAVLVYKDGDMASHLLKFGRGFTDEADLNNVTLFLPSKGEKVKLDVDSTGELLSKDYQLEPGSMIIVGKKKKPEIPDYGVVSVKGQVHNPGSYLIKTGETRLKEVIDMAGGLTREAYLPLSYIIRREENELSSQDPMKGPYSTMRFSDLGIDDTTRYFLDVRYKQPMVSVDMRAALENGDPDHNVVIQDGDLINIKSNPRHVYVFGQVVNPGYVPLVPGKSLQWYIEKAGGPAQGAEPHRARIIRGRSDVWLNGEEHQVYGGDQIYVPREPDEPQHIKLQRYSMYVGIAGTIAGIINVISYILRN